MGPRFLYLAVIYDPAGAGAIRLDRVPEFDMIFYVGD
jgi:hypothetical protein